MADSSVTMVTAGIAGIAVIVTVVGWNVSHYLAKKREDRTLRIESTINKIERQIEEFYGPLLSRMELIFNVWRIREIIFNKVDNKCRGKIDEFVWKEYFLPLHDEIRDLIKVKFYLVDDQKVASSIKEYLEHSTQELFQKRIEKELNISTAHIEGKRWPKDFHPNVLTALSDIKLIREDLIKELKASQ